MQLIHRFNPLISCFIIINEKFRKCWKAIWGKRWKLIYCVIGKSGRKAIFWRIISLDVLGCLNLLYFRKTSSIITLSISPNHHVLVFVEKICRSEMIYRGLTIQYILSCSQKNWNIGQRMFHATLYSLRKY